MFSRLVDIWPINRMTMYISNFFSKPHQVEVLIKKLLNWSVNNK